MLRTSGGSISVEDAGEIDASTSGGFIQVNRASGRVSAHSIRIELARNLRMDLDASASGGSVSSDFLVPTSGDRQDLRAAINGGPLLQLRTSGGGIRIQKR